MTQVEALCAEIGRRAGIWLEDDVARAALAAAQAAGASAPAGVLQKRPVAWRVKDYADGWVIFQDEQAAYAMHEETGALMQGLYVRDGR